jgi:hypothetical protein
MTSWGIQGFSALGIKLAVLICPGISLVTEPGPSKGIPKSSTPQNILSSWQTLLITPGSPMSSLSLWLPLSLPVLSDTIFYPFWIA